VSSITVLDKSGGRHKARVLSREDWAAVFDDSGKEEYKDCDAKAKAAMFQLLARSLGREDTEEVSKLFALGAANYVAHVSLAVLAGSTSGSSDDIVS
jgi:hypothetical protein